MGRRGRLPDLARTVEPPRRGSGPSAERCSLWRSCGCCAFNLLMPRRATSWSPTRGSSPRLSSSLCCMDSRASTRTPSDSLEARYAPHTILWLLANALTLTLLTSEITAYWQCDDMRHVVGVRIGQQPFRARNDVVGHVGPIRDNAHHRGPQEGYAPIRYFAMAVFVITIVKVFAIDLAELDRIYRVLSIIGLGVALLLTSYLYQRSRSGAPSRQRERDQRIGRDRGDELLAALSAVDHRVRVHLPRQAAWTRAPCRSSRRRRAAGDRWSRRRTRGRRPSRWGRRCRCCR